MSTEKATRLFFIKSSSFDLLAIENYLAKRGFEIQSETDIKSVLEKVRQFDPHYVFIAWDHPNEKVQTLPRLINQSLMAIVVPFVQSSTRELIHRLETSGFSHKVYPPVSGPAIIRTVAKIDKESLKIQNEIERKTTKATTQSSTIIVKTSFSTEKPQSFHMQKGVRGELLKYNQSRLKDLDLKKIDPDLKSTLKQEFQTTIKNKIMNITQTHQAPSTTMQTPPLTAMESNQFQKLLCLIVQSDTWCGYLLVASQIEMNDEEFQNLLQAWLQNQFVNMNEISTNDYFEIKLDHTDNFELKTWAEETADYLEVIDAESNQILLCFFSIDPKYLIVGANESYEMLEVPLVMVTADRKNALSLFLHLPDNKKYILYTPANQMLSSQQKNKLLEKNIERLYTPLDFEKELNKMKAEYFLNESTKSMKKTSIS